MYLIAGSDYSVSGLSSQLMSSVDIIAGSVSGSMSLNIIDNTVQEPNETFNVTFSLQTGCLLNVALIGEISFTVTIIDDEGYLK